MSNTYIFPPVVFALVAGMGTVLSKRIAPSFPPPSIEDASVASIAAAKMPTAVHNNVRFLIISCLPFFSSRFSRLSDIICRFGEGFKTMTSVGKVVEFGAKRVRDGFVSSPTRRGPRFVRTGPKVYIHGDVWDYDAGSGAW